MSYGELHLKPRPMGDGTVHFICSVKEISLIRETTHTYRVIPISVKIKNAPYSQYDISKCLREEVNKMEFARHSFEEVIELGEFTLYSSHHHRHYGT